VGSSMLPCVILAGGLATRLYPVTRDVPKALVEVAGEPFVRHQLRLLQRNGISRVVICVGHLGQLIRVALDQSPEAGLDVNVVSDGPTLLGTAGAIRAAIPLLGSAFFVMYGDSYLPCDFSRVQSAFMRAHKKALMTVFCNDGHWDISNVEFANGQIIAYDKRNPTERMRHIDYGLGVFSSTAFDSVSAAAPADLATLYRHLLDEQEVAGYEVTERFYEIGSFDGLQETRELLGSTGATRRPT